jgi:hypothetical protein
MRSVLAFSVLISSVLVLSVLALGLLISLCAPAGAATVRHFRSRHDVIVRPSRDEPIPPGWYKFPGNPPIPPEENRNLDPSNIGSG